MSPGLKKMVQIGAAVGVAGFVILQVFPAGKIGVHVEDIGTNPPGRYDLGAPLEVEAIMRRACYDCHTNETKWPLYARLAPSSWLMARDVHNGRNHLNFSNWGEADEDERQTDRENAWEHIESGDMPPWFYVYPLHLGAKLSDADKATLKGWLMKDAGQKKEGAAKKDADDAAADAPKPETKAEEKTETKTDEKAEKTDKDKKADKKAEKKSEAKTRTKR